MTRQPLFWILLSWSLVGTAAAADEAVRRDWRVYPDFAALREELGWSDDFSARCEHDRPLREISDLINSDHWAEAVVLAHSWLESCPIDIRVHYYTAISLTQLGRETEGEAHWQWAKGLMDSVVASGDGKSPETAYVTISVDEEYDVLYLLGLKPIRQSLVPGERPLDLFNAKNKKGREFEVYFNPSAHFARLAELLSDEPAEP